MMKRIIIVALAAVLTACSGAENGPADHTHAEHDMAEGIVLSKAWVRPPLPGRDMTAGYLEISNGGTADQLLSVTSDIAERVELHTHKQEDGIMKMRKVDTVALPSGETVTFEPGGLHLMMFGVDLSAGQTDTVLTLTFETAPELTIVADITDPMVDKPAKPDAHAGH